MESLLNEIKYSAQQAEMAIRPGPALNIREGGMVVLVGESPTSRSLILACASEL